MKHTSRIDRAIQISARLHKDQVRKDKHKTPYSSHPFAVMFIASKYTKDEDTLVAALLHDVLEDVELPYEEKENLIRDEFGENVLQIVRGVTHESDPLKKVRGIEEWKRTRLKYVENLKTAPEGSLYVAAADKIHNLMATQAVLDDEGESFWSKMTNPPEGRDWFYREVYSVLKTRLQSEIVEDLAEWINKVFPA